MHKSILTDFQKRVLKEFASNVFSANFYLSGGTALAEYYLQHRDSDDLDFFSFQDVDTTSLRSFISNLKNSLKAKSVSSQHIYDRNIFIFELEESQLKVEFTKYPFKQLDKTKIFDNLKVDSLRDISANKIMALMDRFEPKDFVDLCFILQNRKLEDILSDVEKKFGVKISPITIGSELMKVQRIKALPKMLKVLTLKDMEEFFLKLSKQFKNDIFDLSL